MAHQLVSTPRFYCNLVEFYDAINYQFPEGLGLFRHDLTPLPLNYEHFRTRANPNYINVPVNGYEFRLEGFHKNSFIFFLGHKMRDESGSNFFQVREYDKETVTFAGEVEYASNGHINNATTESQEYNGWSLSRFDGSDIYIWPYNANTIQLCNMIVGTHYTMSNAANLSLTQSIEYGSIDEIQSYNGGSFSNQMGYMPYYWGNARAWELYKDDLGTQVAANSGRRVFQLTFSHMTDSDMWGSNQSIAYNSLTDFNLDPNNYEDGDVSNSQFNYNLLDDDNFFSQVWHRTLNGTLSFIMQLDKDNDSPDNFVIAKFRDNTLKVTRSSPTTYDVSVTIEEVW